MKMRFSKNNYALFYPFPSFFMISTFASEPNGSTRQHLQHSDLISYKLYFSNIFGFFKNVFFSIFSIYDDMYVCFESYDAQQHIQIVDLMLFKLQF